jgi:hypothetical protein
MSLRRIYWLIVLALGMWLIAAPLALAGGGSSNFTIQFTLSRTIVKPGDAIQVTGTGAVNDLIVNVLIVPAPTSGANALTAVQVNPQADGSFSATITVPATAQTGRYAVRAEQPAGNGALVRQFGWVGICVNECTGQSLGSQLPETGGTLPGGAAAPLALSGLLVSMLVVQGVRRVRGA